MARGVGERRDSCGIRGLDETPQSVSKVPPNRWTLIQPKGVIILKTFTKEEKHQAVHRYLNEMISYNELAKEVGVDSSALRYWVKLVKYHGDQAFTTPYTNYSPAFKLKVIQYIEEKGYSIREASAIFHIPDYSMVRRWKRKWENGGVEALESKRKGDFLMPACKNKKNEQPTSFKSVEEEMEYLRMEVAYLRSLNRILEEEKKSPSKGKKSKRSSN